jgi:hypothetical protein
VLIRPFEELEAMSRERYQAHIASLPEPKVINIDALVAFSEPIEFTWGGVQLRAPPLPFRAGIRMFVAANALRDFRMADAPTEFVDDTARTAVSLILRHVRPTSRLRRLTRWGRSVMKAPVVEVEGFLRFLLHVEDDSSFPAPKTRPTVDFMANLCDFAREFPGWLGTDGLPRSWAAYIYGSRHMARARAREDLRRGLAMRAARSDEAGYKEFNRELEPVAGW